MAKRGPKPNPDFAEAVGERAAEAVDTISKMDAVRECLKELGADAKPRDAVPWIKSKFGVDVPPGIFSSYKRSINLAAAESEGTSSGSATASASSKGGRAASGASTSSASTKAAATFGTAPPTENPAEAVRAVRQLVDRWGAEFIKELVDLLGPAR